jgi:DNA-directed RNA polymerase subunit RPC12/RpoP
MSKNGQNNKHPQKVPRWMFPASIAFAAVGSAATLLLRGCHHNWSWPMRVRAEDVKHTGDENYSYQVCTKCGIRRLYDEKILRHFGPLGYDLHELIAHDRAAHIRWLQKQDRKQEKLERREKRHAGIPHAEGA